MMQTETVRLRQIIDSLTQVDGWPVADGKPPLAKHQKMTTSPFVFLRGAAPLMYADIARGNFSLPTTLEQIPKTCIMGDCHVSNFGFFTEEGSHGDRVIFSVNDFDDACIGFAHWDLARFLVSLELCRDHGEQMSQTTEYAHKPCVPATEMPAVMQTFVDGYLKTCQLCRDDREAIYKALQHFSDKHLLAKHEAKALRRAAGGEQFLSKSTLAKEVDLEATPFKFQLKPDRFARLDADLYQKAVHAFAPYVDDEILDIVLRLNAGTGSVNMDRYYLLVGPLGAGRAQLPLCHIVEVKQQRQAAPLFSFKQLSAVNRLTPAHLTAVCQRRMQRSPDLVLDELYWRGAPYLVRSRHHARVGLDPVDLVLGKKACKGGFADYARACGQALALVHCRGDRRSNAFETAVCECLPGQVDGLIARCRQYAETARRDSLLLSRALETVYA